MGCLTALALRRDHVLYRVAPDRVRRDLACPVGVASSRLGAELDLAWCKGGVVVYDCKLPGLDVVDGLG